MIPISRILVVVMILLAGCGGGSGVPDDVESPQPTVVSQGLSDATPTTGGPATTNPSGPPLITIPDCPPNASCALGFEIDGEFWGISGLRVRPDSVDPDPVAVGPAGQLVEAMHPINDVAPSVMVAVPCTQRLDCNIEADQWLAAFGSAHANDSADAAMALARAICEHGLNPTAGDKCETGGNVEWHPPSPNLDRRISRFPEYQAEVEAQLARGDGPAWRLDPIETAARYWLEEHGICVDEFSAEYYPRCRVGLGALRMDGGSATLPAVMQWARPLGESEVPYYESYAHEFSLASTGRAWWVVGFREDLPVVHGEAAAGRAASDQLWVDCCVMTIVDVEQGMEPGE